MLLGFPFVGSIQHLIGGSGPPKQWQKVSHTVEAFDRYSKLKGTRFEVSRALGGQGITKDRIRGLG